MSHKATNWLSSLPADALNHSEFRVLFHLCDCHNPSQGCFPAQAYLIASTGVSNGTLNNALNSLERKVLIERKRMFDPESRQQMPTRYKLGFEIEAKAPDAGGGPSPKIGDGPVSNSDAEPSPKNSKSRLQPTGDKPVNKPVINPACARDPAEMANGKVGTDAEKGQGHGPGFRDTTELLASKIAAGKFVANSAVAPGMARDMLARELVTEDQLRKGGFVW